MAFPRAELLISQAFPTFPCACTQPWQGSPCSHGRAWHCSEGWLSCCYTACAGYQPQARVAASLLARLTFLLPQCST